MKIILMALSLILLSLLSAVPSYANQTAAGLNIVWPAQGCPTKASCDVSKRICAHCLDHKLGLPNFPAGDGEDSSGKPGKKGL